MRVVLTLCLLLSAPLSAQLAFLPESVDLGQIPVGTRRLTTVRLYNLGASPVLVEGVTPMDPSLSLPAPPVTDIVHWLAGMDSMAFPVSVMPGAPGPLVGRLQAHGPSGSVSLLLQADAVNVYISEVLADPATGSAGDANGDGERQTYADEFVELHNSGPQSVDLGGWRLGDDDTADADWFVFPPTVLPPGGFAVLFGGGVPAAMVAPTFIDDGRIGDGLANSGDRVLLLTAGGDTASVVDGSDWGHDRSLARSSGDDPLLPHDGVAGVTELFSPGRAARVEKEAAVHAPGRAAATVLIVEILADPASGDAGDANGDGVRDTYADEFIELLSVVAVDVDIGGWSLGDDDTDDAGRFHFPSATMLPAGARLVLFGGGSPAAPWAFVDDGRIGNGLTNSGDVVTLRDAAGDTVDSVNGSAWPADRSSVRTPENCLAACEWRPYAGRQSPADRFSPGVAGSMQGDGTPPPSGILADIRITEILSAPAPVVGDANGDGRIDSYEDEFVELHNAGADAVDLAGWQLSDDDTTPERRFTFPEGTILPPEAYVVLFGGGTPEHDDFVFIDDGRIGNGLTNDGDTVLLIDAMGRIVSTVPFGSVGDTGQSWEISAGLEPHAHGQLPGRSLFSPGSARPVYAAFSVDTLRLTLGRPPPLPVLRGQAPDGGALIDPNSVRWLTLHDDVLRFDGSHPVPLRVGDTVLEAWLQGAVVARAPALVRQPSPANSAPRFISTPPAGAWVAGRFRYEPVVVDDEGTTLAFAPVQLPDWLQIGCDNGILWGRAPPFPGHFEAAIQVTDGQGGLATQAFPLEVRRRPPLRISEVLADPPPGIAGDANGDGVRQTWGDEFVELVNDDTGAIDLDGWQLVDASGQHPFTFPSHTLLNVGSRIVVYGSDAGGRLGNGLDNQRETISVIDPAGPETLAVVRFELAAGPRESLVWDKGEILPQLHSRWPGRLSYSPGRSRPIAVALRLVPARMQLLAGSTASLQPVVRYSDGVSVPLVPQPVVPWSWHQPSVITSLVADTVAGTIVGAITGTAPGRDSVTFTIGNLQASTDVTVRQPLAQSLSFVPGWSQARVTAGTDLSFGVRHRDDRLVQCEWQVSGGGRSHGCQIRWRRSDASGDTVRVLVRSPGGAFGVDELVTHTWLLATNHAPSLSPPSVTELAPLQVFTQALTVSDADSDAVALTLDLAPPGLRLDGRQGILQWTPTGQQLGAHPVRVRASDGRTSTVIDFVLTVGAAPRPALASGCSAALAASPNPFRTDLTLRLCQATGVTARVDVVDMLGRRIRRLPWPAGSTRLSWDALDQAGRPVATGVYFFEWRSATTRHHARAIRLE